MRAYFDSSALIKRTVMEPESATLIETIDEWVTEGFAFASSTLAWIEVTRAIRARRDDEAPAEIVLLIENAVAGIDEYPLTEQVADVARRIGPAALRSLEAVHLATASLVSADLVCAYDERLVRSAQELGFRTVSPGKKW